MKLWWMFALGVVGGGCGLGDLGKLVGEMTVHATLHENTCGSAVGTIPTTSDIHVQFYERSGVLTWVGSQGTFQAEIDPDGNFVFQSSGSQLLRAEESNGTGGIRAACVVDTTEEIRGVLVRRVVVNDDAGDSSALADGNGDADGGTTEATPASVTATDTLQVGASSGADCSDFVGLGSGLFASLPCTVVVDLEGNE